jgi:hypothetical protein
MSDSKTFSPENEVSELSATQPDRVLPVWHKPEISRISIATTSRLGKKFLKPLATTDDFVAS